MSTPPRKSQLDVLEDILEATTADDVIAAQGLTNAQLRASSVSVTMGQITAVPVAIAINDSLSAAIDLGTARLGRIAMPAGWNAANLTLQTSVDGVTFNNLHKDDGTEYTITAAAGRSILVPLADMLSVRYLKLRSGTSALPVVQTAARSIVLVLVP